jgi:hypothetical protein
MPRLDVTEIIEEYDEEVLVREETQEPLIGFTDIEPAQGKPRCITLIFYNHCVYICCAGTLQETFIETTCI